MYARLPFHCGTGLVILASAFSQTQSIAPKGPRLSRRAPMRCRPLGACLGPILLKQRSIAAKLTHRLSWFCAVMVFRPGKGRVGIA